MEKPKYSINDFVIVPDNVDFNSALMRGSKVYEIPQKIEPEDVLLIPLVVVGIEWLETRSTWLYTVADCRDGIMNHTTFIHSDYKPKTMFAVEEVLAPARETPHTVGVEFNVMLQVTTHSISRPQAQLDIRGGLVDFIDMIHSKIENDYELAGAGRVVEITIDDPYVN